MDDFVPCVKIAVYCVENDQENIALGEPKFLGFTFNVKRSEVGYLKAIIEETLKRMDIPYDGIDVYGNVDLPITKIWSKERIIPQ